MILTEARTLLVTNVWRYDYLIIALMLSSKIITIHGNTPSLGARSRVCTVFRLLCYFSGPRQRLEATTTCLLLGRLVAWKWTTVRTGKWHEQRTNKEYFTHATRRAMKMSKRAQVSIEKEGRRFILALLWLALSSALVSLSQVCGK